MEEAKVLLNTMRQSMVKVDELSRGCESVAESVDSKKSRGLIN